MKKQLLLSLSLLLASCITPDEQVARASVLLNSGQEAEAVGLYRAPGYSRASPPQKKPESAYCIALCSHL